MPASILFALYSPAFFVAAFAYILSSNVCALFRGEEEP